MRAPEFWRRDGFAPSLLAPLGWGFDAAGRVRRSFIRPWRAPIPVVCVGNLVAGGAGKTPVALAIGTRFLQRGRRVHFLTRGYGGHTRGPLCVEAERHRADEVGDEALLLARVAPAWVARDRPAGVRAAAAAGAEVVVMDDGHQNASLVKDLSLVVVDAGYGFGNERVIPAGPLRETVSAGLSRADAVVLVGPGNGGSGNGGIGDRLAGSGAAVLHVTLEPTPDSMDIAGKPVVAFAGIGRPEKMFATLAAMGCSLVGRHAFADHHRYSGEEIMAIAEEAAAKGAILVTTEKDFVRLPAKARPMVQVLSVRAAWSRPEALDELLARLFAPAAD